MPLPVATVQKTPPQVLSELSAESGRHVRFSDRISLSQLSHPALTPALERALLAIATIESPSLPSSPRPHFSELQEAFAALSVREKVVASAFTDRALRMILPGACPENVQRKYVWGLVATGVADTAVSLFRVINDSPGGRSPAVLRDAALALSCHRDPISRPLVHRSVSALSLGSHSHEQREAIISGLASGPVLRTAHLISIAKATGSFPRNDTSPTGRFHHVALIKELIAQPRCLKLRHQVIDELGSVTHPFYLWNHPLMGATLNVHSFLEMPPFLIDAIRLAVDLPDPVAQRKAVLAAIPTYREGLGGEGELLKDILARRVGGPPALEEVERFLELLPKSHVRGMRAEARLRGKTERFR